MSTTSPAPAALLAAWRPVLDSLHAEATGTLRAAAALDASTAAAELALAQEHARRLTSPSLEWRTYEQGIRMRAERCRVLDRAIRSCLVHVPTPFEVARALFTVLPPLRASLSPRHQLRVTTDALGAFPLSLLPRELYEELTLEQEVASGRFVAPGAWNSSSLQRYHRGGKALVTVYDTRKLTVTSGRGRELLVVWAAPDCLSDAQAATFSQLRTDGMDHPAALEAASLLA